MKRFSLIGCVLLALLVPRAAAADDPDALAAAALLVFKANCARCHGAGLPRPAGRFGYVLDLRRVAGNPEFVVPGKPEESELWMMIQRNEMPPGKPLSEADKEKVRAWIAADAPPGSGTADDTGGGDSLSDVRRVLRLVGKFHLPALHFPIALLILAAAAEVWAGARGWSGPVPVIRFCVVVGALTAVPTAALGWAFAATTHVSGPADTLDWHRWLGTATAGWAVLTAVVVEHDARRGRRGSVAQLLVLVGAVLVGAAAHFGGALVRGDNFLTW